MECAVGGVQKKVQARGTRPKKALGDGGAPLRRALRAWKGFTREQSGASG